MINVPTIRQIKDSGNFYNLLFKDSGNFYNLLFKDSGNFYNLLFKDSGIFKSMLCPAHEGPEKSGNLLYLPIYMAICL